MISAGQYAKGVNPYGAQPRQPRTKEELEKQLKQGRERLDKMLKKEIAKLKKADPHFRTCPIIEKDKEGDYITTFGDLCRGAKDKLDSLLSHKPDPSIAAAIKKDKLREVPKDEVLTKFQRYYLVRYMTRFKTLTKVKKILKQLKDKPDSASLKKKYNVEYWKFLPLYNASLKSWFKRKYAMVDGKIYQIPSNTKKIKGKGTSTDGDLQCFDRSNGSLNVYKDCSCAIKGGSTGCAWLEEDRFQKKTDKPAENIVRGRIYYHPASNKLRLIPTEKGYAPPKDFKPVSFESLKWFLSRHKKKSEGGKKLLLDFLRADNAASIFLNDDGHYVVDVTKSNYLVHYNAYNDNIHKGQVFPAGIWLSRSDAKTFFAEANKYKPLVALLRVNPFRIQNTAFYTREENGKYQYLLPKDQTMLQTLYEFVNAIKKGKIKSELSKGVVTSLHARLTSLADRYIQTKERNKKDKERWSFQKIVSIIGAFAGIAGTAVSAMFIWHIKSQKKFMVDPESEKQKLKEAGEAKMRKKRLRRYWIRKRLSKYMPWIEGPSSEDEIQAKRDIFEARRAASMREISTEEKEARVLLVNGEETFEVERDVLRNYPHWIVAGWDEAIKKYHAAITRPGGEGAHPLVVGHSRSGKSYVHIGAFNHAAVDWLYRNEKDQVEAKLKEIFVDDKEGKARWEKYAKESNAIFKEYGIKGPDGEIKHYPETGERMVKYVMARYKQISETVPEEVHGRKSGIPDPAKMQAGTEYRGAQAGKQAKLLAAGEKGFVHNFQEVYEALQQGKTRDGAPESMGNLLKHAMGLTSRSSFATGIRHNINVSADTTGMRGLMMGRDQETRDFNGRWYWIPIMPWNAKETLEVMLDPSWREPFEAEMNTRLSPSAIEAAVRFSCKLDAPGGSGMIPRLVAARMVADAIARQRSQGVRGLFELTEKHVVELAKENLTKRIEAARVDAEKKRFQGLLDELKRNPRKFGKEVMELPAEHSMTPDEVRAYNDILNSKFDETKDEGKLSRSIQEYLLVRDPKSAPVVRRMALMIASNETIGDTSDSEEIRVTRAVSLARKLHEIYDRLKLADRPAAGDTGEWTSFVNRNLEKVLPRTDADAYATTMIQEAIMKTMTPYKYSDTPSGEPNLTRMAAVADVIKDRLLELAKERTQAAYGQQATPEALVGEIAMLVEDFERDKEKITTDHATKHNEKLGTELAKYEAARAAQRQGQAGRTPEPADPAQVALKEMLQRRGIQEGTLEHYLAIKFMDPDKDVLEKDFVKIVQRASSLITEKLQTVGVDIKDGLDPKVVDKIAKGAIATATLEMGRPDNDPDKDPTRGPGGKGGAKGPGGAPAPKPATPQPEPAPKPASDGDPKVSAHKARAIAVAKYIAKLQKHPKFSSVDPSTLSRIAVAELNKVKVISNADGKLLKSVFVRVAGAVVRRSGHGIRLASKKRRRAARTRLQRKAKAVEKARELSRRRRSLKSALERLQHPEEALLRKTPKVLRLYRQVRGKRAK